MTTTAQRDGIATIDAEDLARALTAFLGDRRDVGPDAATPGPEPGERYSPIFTALLPVLIEAVPAVIGGIRDGDRDLAGSGDRRDHVERDFGTVLGILLPQLINLLPHLVQAFGDDRDLPRDGDEVTERFLQPLLATLLPMFVQVAPAIVAALTGRSRSTEVLPASSPEFAQRFLGPLLAVLVPALAGALPQLIAAVTGQSRGTQLNWVNFAGQWLPDNDTMSMQESDIDAGFIEFELTQPYAGWDKALRLMIGGTQVDRVDVNRNARESRVMRVSVDQVRGAGYLEFVKAKAFGVMTGMYRLTALEQKAGKRIRFNWLNS
jgi:hypothetical protein